MVEATDQFTASIIVTLHREGILAYKTLRNIEKMAVLAEAKNVTCEILIGLDRADQLTAQLALEFKEKTPIPCQIVKSDFGDSGLNRNGLIRLSKAKYILIHDGDDFFTQNFLSEAVRKAESGPKNFVWVPQILVNFEANHYMVPYVRSSSPLISKRFLFETNYYTSQYLVPRELFSKILYKPTGDGYGYEDWWMTAELIGCGAEFMPVKDTAFFYRRKKNNSLLALTNSEKTLIRKTVLFKPEVFTKLKGVQKKYKPSLPRPDSMTYRMSSFVRNKSIFVLPYKYFLRIWNLHRTVYIVLNDRYIFPRKRLDKNLNLLPNPRSIIERNKKEVPQRMKGIGVGSKLIKEWAKLNKIEPLIRASWDIFEYIPISFYPVDSGFSNAYFDFCIEFLKKEIDDIVFVPHMVRGGAELATIYLTKALTSLGKKVLVVSSLDTKSVWGERIQAIEGAYFIENKALLINVPDEEKRLLFWARVVQYWDVKRVTTINSEFGYKFIQSYDRQLKEMNCRTYVHTYAFDVTEDGYIFNYIPNGLVELYGRVNKYITDSKFYRNQLLEINGFKNESVNALYVPIDQSRLKSKADYSRKNRVIYAARICNQKIADVAVEVGRQLGEQGIELHFFGNIDPEYSENNKFLRMINGIPSVKYMGSFDDFGSLPLDDYDMYLLTTRTEGLANVILEACLSNIYIISAAVGGLPECVSNHRNGYLLPDNNDKFKAEEYCKAILNAYETGECFNLERIQKANAKVARDHSQQKYRQDVSDMILGD